MLCIRSCPNAAAAFPFSSPPPSTKLRQSIARIGVFSAHSNPKILRSNHKSRYGSPTSFYDDLEDYVDDDEEEDSEADDESEDDSSDLEFGGQHSGQKDLKHNSSITNKGSGTRRPYTKGQETRTIIGSGLKLEYGSMKVDLDTEDQVLSLSLEANLRPKYLYLVNELGNEVRSLTKYPMYLSLSLDQRIRPRHRFLVSLRKAPKGPFPLSSFVPTDESFCQQWAGTSLDKYLAFRQSLLLTDFAAKNERKG